MVYADDKTKFFSPSVYDQSKERTLIVHSFSKSYAMPGWRIDGVTGPASLIQKTTLLLETITSCVSPFIQLAAIEAMTGSQKYVDEMMEAYRNEKNYRLRTKLHPRNHLPQSQRRFLCISKHEQNWLYQRGVLRRTPCQSLSRYLPRQLSRIRRRGICQALLRKVNTRLN